MGEMTTIKERLRIPNELADYEAYLRALERVVKRSLESDYDRAWARLDGADRMNWVALTYYYSGKYAECHRYAEQFMDAADEFLLGDWRDKLIPPKFNEPESAWWKLNFSWMYIFEGALLWGSCLGQWDRLSKIATFPDDDAYVTSEDFKKEDRDVMVAVGSFLIDPSGQKTNELLERLESGKRKLHKAYAKVLRACGGEDAADINSALNEYLKEYKKSEFPKHSVSKKISIYGSFVFHWAAATKGQEPSVNEEYLDHIVRLD
jgi:hypothetical protein